MNPSTYHGTKATHAGRLLFFAPMTAITLEGITKRFGRTTAVDQVDLEIGDGQLFFLLGPSGCGKTTLLRMIAGFIRPNDGRIRFGDRVVTDLPPNRRNTGMVFQSYALWPHMTVAENVAYGLHVRKVRGAERRTRCEAALRAVQMQAYARRKPNELSGGQQQRVALARALVIEPTVLLLDEPLSNLDAKLRLEMRSEIKRICAESRITTVYVTHDQKEALSMADTIAVIRDGKVMQVGTPHALYDRPQCRFVADFLGETNFLAAQVTGVSDAGVQLETSAGTLVSSGGLAESPRGGNVTCSIRPESWRLVEQRAAVNGVSGTRLQTIYLGELAQHLIDLGEGTTVKVLELSPRGTTKVGDTVHLAVDPDQVVMLTD